MKLFTNPIGLIWDPLAAFVEKQLNIAAAFAVAFVIVQFTNNFLEDQFQTGMWVQLLVNYVFMFGAALYFKRQEVEDTCGKNTPGSFLLWRGLIESIIAVCSTDVLVKVTPFVPVIGPTIKIVGDIPIVGQPLLWVTHYLIFVMIYGFAKGFMTAVLGKDKYCKKVSGIEMLLATGSLAGSLGTKFMDQALDAADKIESGPGAFAGDIMGNFA